MHEKNSGQKRINYSIVGKKKFILFKLFVSTTLLILKEKDGGPSAIRSRDLSVISRAL